MGVEGVYVGVDSGVGRNNRIFSQMLSITTNYNCHGCAASPGEQHSNVIFLGWETCCSNYRVPLLTAKDP